MSGKRGWRVVRQGAPNVPPREPRVFRKRGRRAQLQAEMEDARRLGDRERLSRLYGQLMTAPPDEDDEA